MARCFLAIRPFMEDPAILADDGDEIGMGEIDSVRQAVEADAEGNSDLQQIVLGASQDIPTLGVHVTAFLYQH